MSDAPTESSPQRTYHVTAWCDRTFTTSFSLDANSPEDALSRAKEQANEEPAEECDDGYLWDTFTVEDDLGAVVASAKPPALASLLDPVRELLAHIEDLGGEFSICREISQSSYALAVQIALAAQGGVA